MSDAADILLIGAGPMAGAYHKVLSAMDAKFAVLGRGQASADLFSKTYGGPVGTGPLPEQLKAYSPAPKFAIVAVPVPHLSSVCHNLLDIGVQHILVEKPGTLTPKEAEALAAKDKTGAIRLAFNRRFLRSTIEARKIIAEDGGIDSFSLEFGEIGDEFVDSPHSDDVIENWIYANSMHVIDLAFFLAGASDDIDANHMNSLTAGSLSRHEKGAIFCGSGVLDSKTLFSYHSNWQTGAGWRVELCTPKRRLFMQPLETLREQKRGGFGQSALTFEDPLEDDYKPGLYKMVETFLADPMHPDLLSLSHQANRMYFTQSMLEGKDNG